MTLNWAVNQFGGNPGCRRVKTAQHNAFGRRNHDWTNYLSVPSERTTHVAVSDWPFFLFFFFCLKSGEIEEKFLWSFGETDENCQS